MSNYTNFAQLTDEELTIWSMDTWQAARNMSLPDQLSGTDENSPIQRITELKKDVKGARAVITLVQDLVGDGRAGDRQLKGYEEPLESDDEVIQIDMIRNANASEGRMAEQSSVVRFREQSQNKLAYWLGDRNTQLAILTLSGISYNQTMRGGTRVGSDFPFLRYAADVKAPTRYRHTMSASDGSLLTNEAADGTVVETAMTDGSVISYDQIVDLKAFAHNTYMRPIRTTDGIEYYHMLVHTYVMRDLKKDQGFREALKEAGPRSLTDNPLFKGTNTVWVDGVAITEHRHIWSNQEVADGARWGDTDNLYGSRCLFLGAQALGYADIGDPFWDEELEDFKNRPAISVGKIFGYLKPQFYSIYTGTTEDFGVIAHDVVFSGQA